MSDGTAGRFVIDLPVWVLVSQPPQPREGLPGDVQMADVPGFGRTLLVFTDADLAARHVADAGLADVAPAEIADRGQFLHALGLFAMIGVRYVAVDFPVRGNPRGEQGVILDAGDLHARFAGG